MNRRLFLLTTRALFAALCLGVFFTGLLPETWMYTLALVAILIFGVATVVFVVFDLDEGIHFVNRVAIRPLLRTNNRLWIVMVGMTMILLLVLLNTAFKNPQLSTAVDNYTDVEQRRVEAQMRERENNLTEYGQPKTNAELGLKSTVPQRISITDAADSDDTRERRFWMFLTMFLLTVVYTPFAFSDEFAGFAAAIRRSLLEKTEGVTANRLLQTAVTTAPALAAAAGAAGVTPASVGTGVASAAKTFATDMFHNWVWDWFRRFRRR